MILDELVLHNFGPYEGKQTIKLAPSDVARPIVLIGGLNGAGKTTLLDGLHLALYGPRAQCSKRGGDGYTNFLRGVIHRGKRKCSDAAVELQFRHRTEGTEHTYRVSRTWRDVASGAGESVEVHVDGVFDPVVTERWAEVAEEFLPLGIANLFLFDGEKIQELADVERASELVRTAIHGLLGLDVVQQLGTDLKVLERRKRSVSRDDSTQQDVLAAEEALLSLQRQAEKVLEQRASAQNELTQARKRLAKLDAQFERQGGKLFEEAQHLQSRRVEVAEKLKQKEEMLRHAAMGVMPLLLVASPLKRIRDRDALEDQAARASMLASALEERDQSILKFMSGRSDPGALRALDCFLAGDRASKAPRTVIGPELRLGERGRLQVRALEDGGLADIADQTAQVLCETDQLRGQLNDADRCLEAVPDKESLKDLMATRQDANQALQRIEGKIEHLEQEGKKLEREAESARAKVVRLKKEWSKSAQASEDTGRVIEYAEKARATLAEFSKKVVGRHLFRIESLVMESFALLLHKKGLIEGIVIDPDTYRIELRDSSAETVHPDKLSAGERQLFAVAMLWGLARASGRPLPAVIDTPLGRLDSEHRKNLVGHYFPQASHQVLLLSTDEEINKGHYENLQRHLAHSYTLEHDDAVGATYVRQGYAFAGR